MKPSRLRLKAEDDEDLTVLSACLQDALVPVGDIAFLPGERRFAMLLNRFCWEGRNRPAGDPCKAERVLATFVVENAEGVKLRGIDRKEPGKLLEVLAVRRAADAGGRQAVEVLFAGDAALRVTVGPLLAHVEDVDEPYPTQFKPAHKLD